ncbi:MAG: radical SAM protein [Myxococcales bacterium]|nr:radical SAM protein [Myxococcales bacterium]
MECTTCAPGRVDRPHTFLAHEYVACDGCGARHEARVVLRDGAVFHLLLCPTCGQRETKVHDDADAYVREFVARPAPEELTGHVWKHTTSTCPSCLALVEAEVVIRAGKVYFAKDCRACGPSEALVSEDAAYYARAYAFARAGTEPLEFRGTVAQGCPTDCGTCGDHEQHTCLPIIEITDHCNLECPVCIVDNQYSTHLAPATFAKMIDGLVAAEGQCESVALSGGEPTSHPQLLELIKIATRPEIGRVVVITNGLRARPADPAHLRRHPRRQRPPDRPGGRALDQRAPHILSLNFQPMAYTGHGGGAFAHDPMDRLTIPGVIRKMDEQSGGAVRYLDFFPLPCSHPQCVSLTYLLRLNDGSCVPVRALRRLREVHDAPALVGDAAGDRRGRGGAARAGPRRLRAPGRARARARRSWRRCGARSTRCSRPGR